MPLVFTALADRCQDSAAALALLAVTGGRKNEVLHAMWDNLDLDRCMLTVPRAKSGRPRHIALSPFAVQVLRRQAARREAGHPFVFPSPRRPDRPLEDVRGAWARVAKAAGLPRGDAHPRPQALFCLGVGQPGHAAERDRRAAGAHPTQHHAAICPSRAAAPSGHRRGGHPCLGPGCPRRGRDGGRLKGGEGVLPRRAALSALVVPTGAALSIGVEY